MTQQSAVGVQEAVKKSRVRRKPTESVPRNDMPNPIGLTSTDLANAALDLALEKAAQRRTKKR
jgi:hypothetical protein